MSSIPYHRGRSLPRLGLAVAWGVLAVLGWGAWHTAPELAPTGVQALQLAFLLCFGLLGHFTRKAR